MDRNTLEDLAPWHYLISSYQNIMFTENYDLHFHRQVGNNLTIPGGTKTIDAKGKLVIPGRIDPHTHMQLPMMGTTVKA